jgi:hypothetical protein
VKYLDETSVQDGMRNLWLQWSSTPPRQRYVAALVGLQMAKADILPEVLELTPEYM